MARGNHVAYYRVSTAKQGRSGLGLEAQQMAVLAYLKDGNCSLAAEFTEVESGKRDDRPELVRAMSHCGLIGATLVIAKLDRLSRDAGFLINLQKTGVDFVAADMPNANRLTVGIMALVAQEEREAISRRTRDALAAAKARGAVLGGWRGGPVVQGHLGVAARQAQARSFAKRVLPTILPLQQVGMSLNQIAAALAASGIMTAQGGVWTATAVRRVLARA